MEQLEALPFEVSIEVVDNVIYLYTNELTATIEIYEAMLDLVNKAFKELRYQINLLARSYRRREFARPYDAMNIWQLVLCRE